MLLTLHKEKGINPRPTEYQCPCCAKTFGGNELILMGSREWSCTCASCGTINYGANESGRCRNCGERNLQDKKTISDGPIKMGAKECPECKKDIELIKEAEGIFIIETMDGDQNSRTGRRWGLSKDARRKLLENIDFEISGPILLMEESACKSFGFHELEK